MQFRSSEVIPFPVDTVFRLIRDRLQDLVPFLPSVKKIETETRDDLGNGRVLLVNRWHGKGEIPAAVQRLVKPEMITWLDTAIWDEEAKTCRWKIETMFFRNNVGCQGTNYYQLEGQDKTRLDIAGDLIVSTKGIPGVPRLLEKRLSGQVEKVIVNLLKPNMESLARGAAAYLRDHQQ